MTKEEYLKKINTIYNKRKDLFKKITKCNKDITKLNQQFIESDCGLKKGDKYILTEKQSNEKEYLIVDKINIPLNEEKNPKIDYINVTFKRVNSNWVKPRRWDWIPIFAIDVFARNNFEIMLSGWDSKKVNE